MLAGFSSVTHLPFPLMAHNLLLRFLVTFILPAGLNSLNPFWFRFPAVLWGTAAIPLTWLPAPESPVPARRLARHRLDGIRVLPCFIIPGKPTSMPPSSHSPF